MGGGPPGAVVVPIDDLRVVLVELGRTSTPSASVVAAANRLRAVLEPSFFDDPSLSDPRASLPGAHHGRDTEKAAAWADLPRKGTQRLRVLAAIAIAEDLGRTDQELEELLEMPRPSPGNRRGELMAGGWVRDSGKTRPTRAGKQAVVWILTEDGARRLAQHEETP